MRRRRGAEAAGGAAAAADEALEPPDSLAPFSVVEALDSHGLWFPAQVLETTPGEVLVSYNGWSNDWNEWLPKRSKRLRKYRGWGTKQRPDDWQADSFCLALDMEDKWCRARILHVSEDAVLVHYQNWSSKWDEWITKDSGRLRTIPQGGAKAVADALDKFDSLCALCEGVGDLYFCEGVCKRAFHAECIPQTNPLPAPSESGTQRWTCSDCRSKRFRCFVCKEWGQAREEVHPCSSKACGMHYHLSCLQASLHSFNGSLPTCSNPMSDEGTSEKEVCMEVESDEGSPEVLPDVEEESEEAEEGEEEEGAGGEEEDIENDDDEEWEEEPSRKAQAPANGVAIDAPVEKRTRTTRQTSSQEELVMLPMLPPRSHPRTDRSAKVTKALKTIGPVAASGDAKGSGQRWSRKSANCDENRMEERAEKLQGDAKGKEGCSRKAGDGTAEVSGAQHGEFEHRQKEHDQKELGKLDHGEKAHDEKVVAMSKEKESHLQACCKGSNQEGSYAAAFWRGAAENVCQSMAPSMSEPTPAGLKQDKGDSKLRPLWAEILCARHFCTACKQKESRAYGCGMVHCLRCTVSYHRKCAMEIGLEQLSPRAILCKKCTYFMPKGLNAPDPIVLGRGGGAITSGDDSLAADLADSFGKAKLKLRGLIEFEVPSELREALSSGQVIPNHDFAPPRYQFIRRSVYIHSEVCHFCHFFRRGIGWLDGTIPEAFPICMRREECTSSNCSCGPSACCNRPFAQLHASGALPLQLIKTERKGWGVKATRDICEGELVIEYVGEVIDRESWEERKGELGRFDHMYFMALNHSEIVDASRRGNLARFINHSCSPNLVVEKWYCNRMPRLGLFAKHAIRAGDELSYNYAIKWFGDPQCAQRCHCLSANCTGFLGPPPRLPANGKPVSKTSSR